MVTKQSTLIMMAATPVAFLIILAVGLRFQPRDCASLVKEAQYKLIRCKSRPSNYCGEELENFIKYIENQCGKEKTND